MKQIGINKGNVDTFYDQIKPSSNEYNELNALHSYALIPGNI